MRKGLMPVRERGTDRRTDRWDLVASRRQGAVESRPSLGHAFCLKGAFGRSEESLAAAGRPEWERGAHSVP